MHTKHEFILICVCVRYLPSLCCAAYLTSVIKLIHCADLNLIRVSIISDQEIQAISNLRFLFGISKWSKTREKKLEWVTTWNFYYFTYTDWEEKSTKLFIA